jgi:hypothetical protein
MACSRSLSSLVESPVLTVAVVVDVEVDEESVDELS